MVRDGMNDSTEWCMIRADSTLADARYWSDCPQCTPTKAKRPPVGHDLVGDLLPFMKVMQASPFDRADMDEPPSALCDTWADSNRVSLIASITD